MGGGRKVGEKVLRWGRLHTCGCIRSTLGTERHFSRPANVIGTRQRPNRTVRGRSESRGRLGSAAKIVRCPQLNPLSARAQTIRSCLQRVARYPAAEWWKLAEDQATQTPQKFLRTVFSQLKWCENPEIFLRRPVFSRGGQNRSSYLSSRKKASSTTRGLGAAGGRRPRAPWFAARWFRLKRNKTVNKTTTSEGQPQGGHKLLGH